MQVMTMLALAATLTTVTIPPAAYYLTKPSEDLLGNTLRRYGFVPINPPSNLLDVGSLYYVDAAVRDFRAICHVDKADLADSVVSSRSWEMQETLERDGRFATGVQVDLGWLFKGGAGQNYVVKVQSSLTDVVLEEVPLGPNWRLFAKLMDKPECNEVAMRYLHAGGYVCQGQKILQATAEFKLDRDAQSKVAASGTGAADDVRNVVKLAIEAQGDQSVVTKEGRLFAGTALKYGISMNPVCLAPPAARFQRVLPYTALGRLTNFVLFNVVEPILPAKPDHLEVAQTAHKG
jgi:hypothetical protein